MGHYAKILNNKVVKVIVAEAEFFDTFVDDSPGDWIQTSYNTRGGIHYTNGLPSEDQSQAFRKNYAGVDFTYDAERDAFIPPKPFDSWVLNETTCWWEAPIPVPTIENDGQDPIVYRWYLNWNEDIYQNDNTKGWTATKENMDGTENPDTAIYEWNGSSWVAQ